ncbi:MAG: hypothetical protein K8963_06790 [Proteobacteria bacterium]|nr:hypothetical protein [Pseudomonadota bacterium]
MELPNHHHTTTVVRTRLMQFRAGLSKLLSATQATVKRCMPATAAERKAKLRAQLALTYRFVNADEILSFLIRRKDLKAMIDVLPGQILAVMAAEPETVEGFELEHCQDPDDGFEDIVIIVNTNVDDNTRKIEIRNILFYNVLEPIYDQVDGRITIRVRLPLEGDSH